MKNVLVFLCGLLLMAACSSKKAQPLTAIEKVQLLGPVMEMREYKYEAKDKFGEIERGEKASGDKLFSFDERGNLTRDLYASHYSDYKQDYRYEYNEQNLVVKETVYNQDGIVMVKRYAYDDNNNKIEEKEYDEDGELVRKVVGDYNEQGQLVKETRYEIKYGEDELAKTASRELSYDDNGNVIRAIERDKAGAIKREQLDTYNEDAFLVESVRKNGDGEVLRKQTFNITKNDNDWRIEQTTDDTDKVEIEVQVVSGAIGRVRGIANTAENLFFIVKSIRSDNAYEQYTYDENFMRIQSSRSRSGETKESRFTIEYDNYKNPVKIIEYNEADQPEFITERVIRYYSQ